MLGPLATAREHSRRPRRVVPFADLPDEVRPDTRLVPARTCRGSPARWSTRTPIAAPSALVAARRRPGPWRGPARRERPRLRLLRRLGPEVALRPERDRLPVRQRGAACPTCPRPGPATTPLEDAERALEPALQRRRAPLRPSASRPPHHVAWALASLDVLEAAGLGGARPRRHGLAAAWPQLLAGRGSRWRRGRLDAGLLRGRRPPGDRRAPARRGHRHPRPPRHARTCARRSGAWNSERGARAARGIGRRGR